MREGIAFTAFTARGAALAARLAAAVGGTVRPQTQPLAQWTAEQFPARAALVFVGAAGIAVRAAAPFLRGKAEDPAVIALDEGGRYVIPLASGHLGGANDLARTLADLCGGTAVITTATDLRGVFAVDLWARRQDMAVLRPERIKRVSAKLLAGETVSVFSPWPVAGTPPEGVTLAAAAAVADVLVDVRSRESGALCLAPRALTLGIGCRRGTAAAVLEAAFVRFCGERQICPQAVRAAASIDLKADEAGLLAFCQRHGWPTGFYPAAELAALPGEFTASAFVAGAVGVDNVCERSAVRASGGALLEKKYAAEGVTLALAMTPPALDWSF